MRFGLRFLPALALPLALATPAFAQQVTKSPPPPSPALEAEAAQLVQMLRDANDAMARNDTDTALQKVNAVIQADPRSLAGYVLRGAIYSQLKQWDKAQGDYEAANLINPHSPVVQYNLAEVRFAQKEYDAARPGFVELEANNKTDIGDLATYKVFLCDLFGGHEPAAARDLEALDDIGSNPSYYFAHAAWSLYHHKPEEARSWLRSANGIYSVQKNGFYASSLFENGYLPLPRPPPGAD
jgi:Tfp pilus assembly protein PilF